MLTTSNSVGRAFIAKLVPESQVRSRLAIYEEAREKNRTSEDDNPHPDQVSFESGGLRTEVLLSKNLLLARTKDDSGQVIRLEKVEDTLILANREGEAQEVIEQPNGDGYWMESDWYVRDLPGPDSVFQQLNEEFESSWTNCG